MRKLSTLIFVANLLLPHLTGMVLLMTSSGMKFIRMLLLKISRPILPFLAVLGIKTCSTSGDQSKHVSSCNTLIKTGYYPLRAIMISEATDLLELTNRGSWYWKKYILSRCIPDCGYQITNVNSCFHKDNIFWVIMFLEFLALFIHQILHYVYTAFCFYVQF